jgi:hypothetical protein
MRRGKIKEKKKLAKLLLNISSVIISSHPSVKKLTWEKSCPIYAEFDNLKKKFNTSFKI